MDSCLSQHPTRFLVGDLQIYMIELVLTLDIVLVQHGEFNTSVFEDPTLELETLSWSSLNLPDHRYSIHTVKRENGDEGVHKLIKKVKIKMIQVKEMMQDNDLKNSKSKDKGSRSRSQSMNEQSHYKQDKTKTRQSINVKSHILNVIGGTEECEERDLNIGGDC
ncbi:hypothetical protein Tco_0169746 [Tanacetum coccineum]